MKKTFIIILACLAACSAFAQSAAEMLAAPKASYTYDAVVDITAGTSSSDLVSALVNSDGNLEVTYTGSTPITIALSGKLDGTLIMKSDNADYTLALDGVTITGKKLPGMQLKSTTTATLLLVSDDNYISDSASNGKKGAITSGGNVTITGEGSLVIGVFKKHGLKTDGGVTIESGNVSIQGDENAEGNMISADLFFVMNGGNLDILAKGNVHATESKGIKVNGVEGTGTGLGYVEINDGYINIVSVGKAITAGWKLSEDAETETTDDDPIPDVYINGGEIYIQTTGTPYEYSDDESLSPEGIEAKNILYINGGYVYAVTTDDTLNAGTSIVINGGYVYARSSANDSIDSNGTIEINGGTVITMSSSWEQAFDCDNDAWFKYTGGTYVGAGNGNNMPKAEGTSACSIAYGNKTFYAGDQIAVLDSNGNVVMGFVVPYEVPTLTSIVFGSPDLKLDETYTLALGAYQDNPTDGLAEAGATFTAREEVVTMDMTDYTVSEGYIGMNIGLGATGMGGMGGFGGKGGMMGDMGAMGGFADRGAGRFAAMTQETPSELPAGVVLPETLSSEDALQVISYIIGNFVDIQDAMQALGANLDFGAMGAAPDMGSMPDMGTAPDMSAAPDMSSMPQGNMDFGAMGPGSMGQGNMDFDTMPQGNMNPGTMGQGNMGQDARPQN